MKLVPLRSLAALAALAICTLPGTEALGEGVRGGPMCRIADCMAKVVEDFERRGWLGMGLQGSPSLGLRVGRVDEGGPAAAAGIAKDDFILAIDGQQVDLQRPEALQPLLARSRPGEVVELKTKRGDEVRVVRVRARQFPSARLDEAIGSYVRSAIHLCHHPDHQVHEQPPAPRGRER